MEIERALLASPEHDAIVKAAAVDAGVTTGVDRNKRPAESPSTNEDKRQRITLRNRLKIVIKRKNADVDEVYFRNLCGHIFEKQQQCDGDFNPAFFNSGHTQGLGWFCACNEESLSWIKTILAEIQSSGAITDFSVMPYSPIPPLRRVILSVPSFPSLEKSGADKILAMITRLNKNLNTKYWKVTKILPPENGTRSVVLGIDEESVIALERQGNIIFYGLGQISLKIYSRLNSM